MKVDIQCKKVDIESGLSEKGFSAKTIIHSRRLFDKFGYDEVLAEVPLQSSLN